MTFETDAVNDYFSRLDDPGEFSLALLSGTQRLPVSDYVGPNLHNGVATLSLQLPPNCQIGDSLVFEATTNDQTTLNPFVNILSVKVIDALESSSERSGQRKKSPNNELGQDRELPGGISLPEIVPIYEADWPNQDPPFDKNSALRVRTSQVLINADDPTSGEHDVYDFLINMDNFFLKSELKSAGDEIELIRARWKYALVLIGLSLLHDDVKNPRESDKENSTDVEAKIESFTRALAPVILPMIDSLGALELEASLVAVASGEAT